VAFAFLFGYQSFCGPSEGEFVASRSGTDDRQKEVRARHVVPPVSAVDVSIVTTRAVEPTQPHRHYRSVPRYA